MNREENGPLLTAGELITKEAGGGGFGPLAIRQALGHGPFDRSRREWKAPGGPSCQAGEMTREAPLLLGENPQPPRLREPLRYLCRHRVRKRPQCLRRRLRYGWKITYCIVCAITRRGVFGSRWAGDRRAASRYPGRYSRAPEEAKPSSWQRFGSRTAWGPFLRPCSCSCPCPCHDA